MRGLGAWPGALGPASRITIVPRRAWKGDPEPPEERVGRLGAGWPGEARATWEPRGGGKEAKSILPITKKTENPFSPGSFSHLSSSILQTRETEAWVEKRPALGRPESLGFWIPLEDDLWDPDLPNTGSEMKAGPPSNTLNWGSSLSPNC